MKEDRKNTAKQRELEQQLGDLMLDLQRTRADFENYRKRVDAEKSAAREYGRVGAISQLLPILDTINKAISQIPEELQGDAWVQGVSGLGKQLAAMMKDLGIEQIDAGAGAVFNPELHEAVSFDNSDGATEIIAEELQPGYMLGGEVLRHSKVRVTSK